MLLAREVALRREMEAVAEQRRTLPLGGVVPEDYVFQGEGTDGQVAGIRLSELFAPGRDTLLIYSYMFPRHREDDRPGPPDGETAELTIQDGPCPSCTSLLDQCDGAALHATPLGVYVAATYGPVRISIERNSFEGRKGRASCVQMLIYRMLPSTRTDGHTCTYG